MPDKIKYRQYKAQGNDRDTEIGEDIPEPSLIKIRKHTQAHDGAGKQHKEKNCYRARLSSSIVCIHI